MNSILLKVKNQVGSLRKRGFFHILLGGTLTKVIAFFSSILIVRFVTKDDYAYLTYADNIYSYVYLIVGLGLDSAVLKYCVKDDLKVNKGFVSFAFKVGCLWCISLIIAVLCFVNYARIPFPQARVYMLTLAGYPFLYFCLSLIQAFMRARLKNREFAYAGIIQTIIVFAVSIGFVFKIGAFSVIIARYVAVITVLIYCIHTIYSEIRVEKHAISTEQKKSFMIFGISVLTANVFSMIMPINEVFLVNNLIQDTVVTANYRVANLIPQQLTFVTTAIITFYFPYFARLSNKREIWEKSRNVGLMTAAIIAVVTVIGIIVSPLIIQLAYGDKYSDINFLMSALWVMHSLNAGARMLPMNILPAIGYTKFNVIMSIVASAVHFAIDYYCIKTMGVNGAVIAGCVVYIVTALCYWTYLRYKTRKER